MLLGRAGGAGGNGRNSFTHFAAPESTGEDQTQMRAPKEGV